MTVIVIENQEKRRKGEHGLVQGQVKTVILQGIPAVKLKSQKREAEDHPEVVVEHQTEGEVKVVQGGQGHVVEIDMRQVDGKVTQGHLIIAAGEDQEVDQEVLIDVVDLDLGADIPGHIHEKEDRGRETREIEGQGHNPMEEQVLEGYLQSLIIIHLQIAS